ncbi:hypothetical protein KUTeg_007791 [Tegillarca granosa]|uniref:SUEL-type lectin domain-containing protein n=1 Tax=Tegillarca granosa TaxID=220873 RepID=A0ABQ9FHJ9_TEGGR|nr:hypothetical protein KUTeg_007791 [Tegillarca granosa]
MMLFLHVIIGTIMQAIDWSNSVTIEEKYITLCIYKTGSVYFAEDRIMSCIKQGGVIRLTHEIYDKSSYDNNGYCILLNTNSCHFQHSYRYSDTRILDLIEDCYGQRECRPNIPQSYWDYPYSLFQKTQNCSDVEKHKIGIKIFYKCTDELSIITESSKSTKEYTEVPSSDSGSSEGYTVNSECKKIHNYLSDYINWNIFNKSRDIRNQFMVLVHQTLSIRTPRDLCYSVQHRLGETLSRYLNSLFYNPRQLASSFLTNSAPIKDLSFQAGESNRFEPNFVMQVAIDHWLGKCSEP